MKQEIIVVIGLGHPLVGLAQHIVKALLQNFRQKLSLLRCLIVKDLASGYIFLMVTVLVNADHQIRCRLIYDFAPFSHVRHLFMTVPRAVKSLVRVPGKDHLYVGGLKICFQLL